MKIKNKSGKSEFFFSDSLLNHFDYISGCLSRKDNLPFNVYLQTNDDEIKFINARSIKYECQDLYYDVYSGRIYIYFNANKSFYETLYGGHTPDCYASKQISYVDKHKNIFDENKIVVVYEKDSGCEVNYIKRYDLVIKICERGKIK